MPTKVYQFGLLPPRENSDVARKLMYNGHQLRNQLVEIENAFRAATRQLFDDLPAVQLVEALNRDYEALAERMRLARMETNSKKLPPNLAAEKSALLASLRAARDEAKKERSARMAEPAYIVTIDEMTGRLKAMRKAAYLASGVTPGVRAIMTDAIRDSAKSLQAWQDLRFRRWDGNRHRIATTSPSLGPTFWGITIEKKTRRASFGELRLRVGSNPDRTPIWATWPLIMHRELPPGKIAGVVVSMTPEANRERWTVEITVSEIDSKPSHGIGTVAANLGWRSRPDGTRVLYCVDEAGTGEEFVVPSRIAEQLDKASSLRCIRSREMNAMVPVVVDKLASLDIDWLPEATRYSHQWLSARRWHKLFLRLREHGFGDAVPELRDWYHQDIHLWQWEAAQRRKALNSRKDFYRNIAARLSKRYDALLLCNAGRAKLAQEAAEQNTNPTARHNRVAAGTYELELLLRQAFVGRQATVHTFDAAHKTTECHQCGEECVWDAAAHLEHTCEHCGATWDQDDNHCRNLLSHFRERPGDATVTGGLRKEKPAKNKARRTKMAEGAAKRRERVQAARKALGNPVECQEA